MYIAVGVSSVPLDGGPPLGISPKMKRTVMHNVDSYEMERETGRRTKASVGSPMQLRLGKERYQTEGRVPATLRREMLLRRSRADAVERAEEESKLIMRARGDSNRGMPFQECGAEVDLLGMHFPESLQPAATPAPLAPAVLVPAPALAEKRPRPVPATATARPPSSSQHGRRKRARRAAAAPSSSQDSHDSQATDALGGDEQAVDDVEVGNDVGGGEDDWATRVLDCQLALLPAPEPHDAIGHTLTQTRRFYGAADLFS